MARAEPKMKLRGQLQRDVGRTLVTHTNQLRIAEARFVEPIRQHAEQGNVFE